MKLYSKMRYEKQLVEEQISQISFINKKNVQPIHKDYNIRTVY